MTHSRRGEEREMEEELETVCFIFRGDSRGACACEVCAQ